MAIRLEATKSFDAASPVARYWLTQCQGFRVGGAGRGTVEEIVGGSDPYAPELLVVRAVRRREIPVSAVEAVVPAERLILVRDDEPARDKPKRVRAVRSAGGPLVRVSKRVAVAGLLALVVLVRLLRPLGRLARRGSAFVAASGVAAFRASRRYAIVLGPALLALGQILSARGSAAVRDSALIAARRVRLFWRTRM